MTNLDWWTNMANVINDVEPLYIYLLHLSRMITIMSGTYVQTACALNPFVHYTMGTTQNVLRELRKGLDKMLDAEGAAMHGH